MRRARKRGGAVLAITVFVALAAGTAGTALAALANDSVGGAIALTIPQTYTEDTTGSNQSDADEVALNASCGAPLVEHGVWFSVTPAADGFYAFDTTASSYSAGMMVFDGAPSGGTFITCGPQQVIPSLIGGHTYNILAFGDGGSAATSGSLVISTRTAVPPPDISLVITNRGTVARGGVVHLSGTATCTSANGSGQLFEIFGDVTQRIGRIVIHGSFDISPFTPCDGTPQPWDAFFSGDDGIFAGGKAITVAVGFGCTDFCSKAFTQATVQLDRSGK
jgi:hypothetical protein